MKDLEYRTGNLIYLLKCQGSNIKQSFEMNITIFFHHITGLVFGVQGLDSGSGAFFDNRNIYCKNRWSPSTNIKSAHQQFHESTNPSFGTICPLTCGALFVKNLSVGSCFTCFFLTKKNILQKLWVEQFSTQPFSKITSSEHNQSFRNRPRAGPKFP